MADNLKEVIARLKQKNSQTSEKIQEKTKQNEDEDIDKEENEINKEEEVTSKNVIPEKSYLEELNKAKKELEMLKQEKANQGKTEEEKRLEMINSEIELLGSNEGFYRRQLLIQLTELNTTFAEIEGILNFFKRKIE